MEFYSDLKQNEIITLLSFPLVMFRDIVLVRDDNYALQSNHIIYSFEKGLTVYQTNDDSIISNYIDFFFFNVDKLHKDIYEYPTLRKSLVSLPISRLDPQTTKDFFSLFNTYVESLAEGSFIPPRERKNKRFIMIAEDIKENLDHYRQMFSIENLQK